MPAYAKSRQNHFFAVVGIEGKKSISKLFLVVSRACTREEKPASIRFEAQNRDIFNVYMCTPTRVKCSYFHRYQNAFVHFINAE